MNLSDLAKHSMTRNVARSVCDMSLLFLLFVPCGNQLSLPHVRFLLRVKYAVCYRSTFTDVQFFTAVTKVFNTK